MQEMNNKRKKAEGISMRQILVGQALLVMCCIFYLIWWYRGFRPGVIVNRVGGVNGLLLLITALEIVVINRLNAAGVLTDGRFLFMCFVIAAAFLISMILYVAYYKMEEMSAFYAAMIPLITEGTVMAVLIGAVII